MSDNQDFPTFDTEGKDLSTAAKKGVINATVAYFVSNNISKKDAFAHYVNQGLDITRSAFNKIYDTVSQIETLSTKLRNVNKDKIPTDAIIPISQYKMDNNYLFYATITAYNTETDEIDETPFAIYLSNKTTIGNIEQQILDYFASFPSNQKYDEIKAKILKAYRKA